MGNEGFEGVVDRIEDGVVYGWAWDSQTPGEPIGLQICVDSGETLEARADRFRPDLKEAGIGDGEHAFQADLPDACLDGRPHTVRVTYGQTDLDVPGSPYTGVTAAVAPDPPATYRSPFGGLWIDLSNASEIIDGKEQLGMITSEQATLLRTWLENGFVVLEGAIPHETIDRLNSDIDDLIDNPDPNVFAESYESGGVRIAPLRREHKDLAAKLLDLYAHLESAREVTFAKPIVEFLGLLFERPVLAFQGLCFKYGTEQPIHCDNAYVRVSSAMEIGATWVALEDIQPGSGELEYYVGSHKLSDFLFEGDKKWMPANSPEHADYLQSLHRKSAEQGLGRVKFLPKKGDVLVWSAGLYHGGSRITNPVTRRSFVTHYCPLNCNPVYSGRGEVEKIHYKGAAHYAAQQRQDPS